tara:strand:- start:93201 stop:95129 length:1929 start_codon:yes stop_codon:yes gene_type:complete
MQLTDVIIENFLGIGKAELKLSDKGLVLIQGENVDETSADSNGAGKSSIPDAPCWCLYNVTARGVSGDEVINDKVKKNCKVQVKINDDGTEYLITRYRKHHAGKGLHISNLTTGENLTKGTDKLTQEVVVRIMGCSVDVFTAAVYAGQEKMPNLPGMTDKQLKLLVEEGAGIDRLSAGYLVARAKMNNATATHDISVGRVESVMGNLEDAEMTLGDHSRDIDDWNDNQKVKIIDETNEAKEYIKDAKVVQAAIAKLDEPKCTARMLELDAKIAGVVGENEERAKKTYTINQANSAIAIEQRTLTAAEGVLLSINNRIKNVDSQVGKPCGECGKKYHKEDLGEALNSLTAQQDEASDLISESAGKIETASLECVDLQADLDAFVDSMTDISTAQSEQLKLRETINIISIKKVKFSKLKANATSSTTKVRELKVEDNPHINAYDTCKLNIKELQKKLEVYEGEAEADEKRVALSKDAVEVFSPAGVRAHILDTVTPYLNDRTAHYLSTLSDGNITAEWSTLTKTAKGDLREKFNIKVQNTKGAKSFAGLSGGEKRKVRIASSMALQDLVASRASKPIDLFIADEVDDALDSAGLERLMTILEEKARHRGTVLVISHNSLSDWIREQAIVKREDGLSTITGALCG